jgi:hypothetical protein
MYFTPVSWSNSHHSHCLSLGSLSKSPLLTGDSASHLPPATSLNLWGLDTSRIDRQSHTSSTLISFNSFIYTIPYCPCPAFTDTGSSGGHLASVCHVFLSDILLLLQLPIFWWLRTDIILLAYTSQMPVNSWGWVSPQRWPFTAYSNVCVPLSSQAVTMFWYQVAFQRKAISFCIGMPKYYSTL